MLNNKLPPLKYIKTEIEYEVKLPQEGFRFNNHFYLAQWYPMVPTYKNGWNKEKFLQRGEFYHTNFSNFTINYSIPKGYSLFSASDEETFPTKIQASISAKNVKEFFIAVIKNPYVAEQKCNGTNIRIIHVVP